MATVARVSRQGYAHVGRQPPSGFIADGDLPHLKPRRGRNHRVDAGRHGICSAKGQTNCWVERESGKDGGQSGPEKILTRVYEPLGQSGGVPPVAARGARRSAGDRTAPCAGTRIGFDRSALLIPNNGGRTGVPDRRGYRPAVWSPPPEARHRAPSGQPACEAAWYGAIARG